MPDEKNDLCDDNGHNAAFCSESGKVQDYLKKNYSE